MKSKKEKNFGLHFACRVEKIMRKKGLQWWHVFREDFGLSQRVYYRLFEKNYNPTLQTICTIAEALKVHPKELLDFDTSTKEERPKYVHFYYHDLPMNERLATH
jgi:hypothetical protein